MNTLINTIRTSVLGEGTLFTTAFGKKPLVYADYTASGRSLRFIEDYIQQKVLPFYANTHTETSYTSAHSTALREEARQEIRHAVNAGSDDKVIFCGSGATAAIHKLIDMLNLRLPAELSQRYSLLKHIPPAERPVIFIGPYEHHSNELPWRESIAKLIVIPLDNNGQLDLIALEDKLKCYRNHPLRIGSFSAASNVTGVKTNMDAVAQLLHRYDTLSFWDCAAMAPYAKIDMTGHCTKAGDSSKDALFISPHKFIGGPGTPGILIVKKHLLNNRVPAVPGGGTVIYVSPKSHRYVDDIERREEGGTPAIVESIRAGLVFKLQQTVGIDEIERRENDFMQRALARWSKYPAIEILGNPYVPHLSVFSLRIKYAEKDLHYNFVVALLNDLFGIQARGGCSCAGPYGHTLLNLDMNYSRALEEQILNGHMILRPGWIRLNFNYFIDEDTFEYLVRAIELVAEHGWRLLPFYNYNQAAGVWRYQDNKTIITTTLNDLEINNNSIQINTLCTEKEKCLHDYLAIAEEEIQKKSRIGNTYQIELPGTAEKLRWFVLPQDINDSKAYNPIRYV